MYFGKNTVVSTDMLCNAGYGSEALIKLWWNIPIQLLVSSP